MNSEVRVGITGASGFIGKHLVKNFLRDGYSLNLYVRNGKSVKDAAGAEFSAVKIFEGDIADSEKLSLFIRESDFVIHLASGTSGKWKDYYNATVRGSELTASICARHKIRKLIYISSVSVYDILSLKNGAGADEDVRLDDKEEARGWYARAKILAEKKITSTFPSSLPIIVLRPGLVYAPNMKNLLVGCGIFFGRIIISPGIKHKRIPFVHIDDLYKAVRISLRSNLKDKIYNVVGDEQPEIGRIVSLFNSFQVSPLTVIYIPKFLFFLNRALGKFLPLSSSLGRYNHLLLRTQKNIYYSNQRIKNDLGWSPKIDLVKMTEQMAGIKKGPAKIGVVGCGFAFQALHLPAILGNKKVTVRAIYDNNQNAAVAMRDKFFKNAEVFDRMEQFESKDGELDFVAITTPPETHFQFSSYLMKKGHNVLLEKPPALNIGDAVRLEKIQKNTNVSLGVIHNYRLRKNTLSLLRSLKKDGGKVKSVSVNFYSGPVGWGSGDWRKSVKYLLLYEMAYHFIDIAILAAGKIRLVERAHIVYNEKNGMAIEINAKLKTENGAAICLDLKLNPPYAETEIKVMLEKHAYVIGFYPERFYKITGDQNPLKEIARALKTIIGYGISRATKKNNAHRLIYDEFAEALESGKKPSSDISETLPVMEAIEKIIAASKKNS